MGPEDAALLAAAGYDAVLVGESVVVSDDRRAAVTALRRAPLGLPDLRAGE
jgi:indole-3-glycerol phosphate synthase